MLYDELYDWQKQIIDSYRDRQAFGLWLDMGLGKTPLSLAFAEAHDCEKILIVSINKKATEDENVKDSFFWWANHMKRKYALHDKRVSFREEGALKWRRKISADTNDILLLNYEALYRPGQSIAAANGKKRKRCVLTDIVEDFVLSCAGKRVAVIVDESHKIKELDSLQTMAIKKITQMLVLKKAKVWTYLLTGTPFTKGYEDLYAQLKFLGWEGNKETFVDNFCIRGRVGGLLEWQQPIIGYKNVDKLYALVHRYAMTVKTDSVVKLPEQVFVYHKLKSTEDMTMLTVERLKKELIEGYASKRNVSFPYPLEETTRGGSVNNPFYRNAAFPEVKWLAETAGSFWMRSRQMSVGFQGNDEDFEWYSRDRLDAFEELLRDHEDNYVVFYNYEPEFFELFDVCYRLGYSIDVCNGSIKSEYFYSKYCSQTDGERLTNKKNVILANFKSGSAGANWQMYDKCVLFSLPGFGDYQQSIKRIHRLGQKSTVIYHVFYAENWLDLSMLKALRESKEYDKDMFESDLKRVQTIMSQKPQEKAV